MKQVLFQVATIIFSGIIFLVVYPFEVNAETDVNTEKGPRAGVFPSKESGIHVHGDLVISDSVNRRGALREKEVLLAIILRCFPMVWFGIMELQRIFVTFHPIFICMDDFYYRLKVKKKLFR